MPAAHNGATTNSAPGNQLISGLEVVHSLPNGKANGKSDTGHRDSNEKPRGPRRDGKPPVRKQQELDGGAGDGIKAAQQHGFGKGRGPKPTPQHSAAPNAAGAAAQPIPGSAAARDRQPNGQQVKENPQAPPAQASNGNPAAGPRMFQRHMGTNNSRGAEHPGGHNSGHDAANVPAAQPPARNSLANEGAVPANALPGKQPRPPRPPRGPRPESARTAAPNGNSAEAHPPAQHQQQQGGRPGTAPEPGMRKKQGRGGHQGGAGHQLDKEAGPQQQQQQPEMARNGQVQQGTSANAGKQARAPKPRGPKPKPGAAAAVVQGQLTQADGGSNAVAVRPPPPPPPPRGPPPACAAPVNAGPVAPPAAGHHAEPQQAQAGGNRGKRQPRSAKHRGPPGEHAAYPQQNGTGNPASAPPRQRVYPARNADDTQVTDSGHDFQADQQRPRQKQPRQGSGRHPRQGGRDAHGNGVHEGPSANGSVPTSPSGKRMASAPSEAGNNTGGGQAQDQARGPAVVATSSPRSARGEQGRVNNMARGQEATVTAPAAAPPASAPAPVPDVQHPGPAPVAEPIEAPLTAEPPPPAPPAPVTGGVHNEFAERMAQQALARLAARASMTAAAKASAPPVIVPLTSAGPPSPGANGGVHAASVPEAPISDGNSQSHAEERPRLRLLPRTQGTAGSAYVPAPPVSESSGYSSSCAPPPVDGEGSWVAAKQTVPPPAGSVATDGGRPKLQLAPRTKALESSGAPGAAKSNPFGAARPREEILKERGVDAALLDLDPGPRQYISTGNQGTRASRAGSVTSGDEHGPGDQWTTVGKQGRPRPKEESNGDFYELDLFGAPMRNPPPPRFFGGPPPPGPGDYAHFSSSYGSPRNGFGGGFNKGPGIWFGRASDDLTDDAFVMKRALPLRAADV